MHILFVSHYFPPEVGAPQTRILESAQRLGHLGHQVTVLTGFPNYPDGIIPDAYRGKAVARERVGEVDVIRTAVYPAPNRGFARRIVNHTSFAVSSLLATPLVRRVDVAIVETPPLFTAVSGVLIARALRAPVILNVADLWPESAVQLGMLSNPRAIRAAEMLETFAYRHSALITVPTAGMRTTLLQRGEPEGKVVHLPNAVDTDRFATLPPATAWSQAGTRPRVIYSGTVGLAQGVGTLVEAAAEFADGEASPEFLIVGDGAERESLQAEAAERGLGDVRFAGRVPRDEVPGLIGSAGVAVLSLVDVPLFEDALPTKMLEYMAAARPVVASAAGDVSRLLARAEAGVACAPGDATELAAGIRTVLSDPDRAARMGENGRRYVESHYSRAAFVATLERLAESITGDDAEQDRVKRTYAGYAASARRRRAWSGENPGNRQTIGRMFAAVGAALNRHDRWPGDGRRLLDVGCGHGDLLGWLQDEGVDPAMLMGVDLLPERVEAARKARPEIWFEVADARELPIDGESVDAVVLSTVLSSVIGPEDRTRVAAEAMRVLRPGGLVLSYDIRYPSPRNRNVRAITRSELGRLFPSAELNAETMTLLPPLARRLGSSTSTLYGPLLAVRPLRTHLLAVAQKADAPRGSCSRAAAAQ